MEHNRCKIYGQTIMGNLNNFQYGLTKEYQEELQKEYESIGKLSQADNQETQKINGFTGYSELFNNNCNINNNN